MKEADLYPALKRWLEGQGLQVYPEVAVRYRHVDVVGLGAEVVGVEMKRSMTRHLIYQANSLTLFCHRSYVAIASMPRSLEGIARHGIGVLRVVEDQVWVLKESTHPVDPNPHVVESLRETCSKLTGAGTGGVPNLDGVGPAQDCKRRVDLYRKDHPNASWGEIWLDVPNHYANAKSMQGALTTGLQLRAHWKNVRRRQRLERAAWKRHHCQGCAWKGPLAPDQKHCPRCYGTTLNEVAG